MNKTRNNNTLTESAFWSMIRSTLRKASRYWKPIQQCKLDARRPNQSTNKRLKYEYQCSTCSDWFPEKEIAIDHIIPVGSLKSGADLEGFVERLFTENGFQVLCLDCHQLKTNEERTKKTCTIKK